MGAMQVLCDSGDIVVSWNPGDADSARQAREEFNRLKKDGYEFFDKQGEERKRITSFKPTAGEIIAVPGVQTKKDRATGKREGAMAGQPNDRLLPHRVR